MEKGKRTSKNEAEQTKNVGMKAQIVVIKHEIKEVKEQEAINEKNCEKRKKITRNKKKG